MPPNNGLHSTRLSPLRIGGPTRFVVALVAKALSRSRRAGEANRYLRRTIGVINEFSKRFCMGCRICKLPD